MILRCTKKQKDEILEWAKNNIQCTKCLFNEKCAKSSCTKELQSHIIFDVVKETSNKQSQLRKIMTTYLYLYDKYLEDNNTVAYGYLRSLLIEKIQLLDGQLDGKHINDYADFVRADKYIDSKDLWDKCVAFETKRGEVGRQ